eukprot:scaffold285_cov304-Pinguiococcus_pyrenoidosus.AAC.17
MSGSGTPAWRVARCRAGVVAALRLLVSSAAGCEWAWTRCFGTRTTTERWARALSWPRSRAPASAPSSFVDCEERPRQLCASLCSSSVEQKDIQERAAGEPLPALPSRAQRQPKIQERRFHVARRRDRRAEAHASQGPSAQVRQTPRPWRLRRADCATTRLSRALVTAPLRDGFVPVVGMRERPPLCLWPTAAPRADGDRESVLRARAVRGRECRHGDRKCAARSRLGDFLGALRASLVWVPRESACGARVVRRRIVPLLLSFNL